ncbi:MAG: hypothetical protein AB7I35_08145 [Ramlibacter sp.]
MSITENGMSIFTLASMGRLLIEYGLLGVLVTMPPALFLILGLKSKGRLALLSGGGFFLALGCLGLGIALEGIGADEVLAFSRSTLMVAHTANPVFFWVSAVGFLALSSAMAGLGFFLLKRACFPLNTPASPDRPEAGRLP